jgi:hypothetical protein
MNHSQILQNAVRGIRILLLFTIVLGVAQSVEAAQSSADNLVGQPAELSAWASAYRADRKVQDSPEANFVLRRLERLDQVYRPLSLLLSQESEKKQIPNPPYSFLLSCRSIADQGAMLPPAIGVLQSALLWEGRMRLNRLELQWPGKESAPPPQNVEVRVYPSPYGWFGWQRDQQVTVSPEMSADGRTWVYNGDWNDVDMVAVFVASGGSGNKEDARKQSETVVPQIRAYGPEKWERVNLEIEWGVKGGTEKADFDGRVEGFFGLVSAATPLSGDPGTTMEGPASWKSRASGGNRRGIALSLLCIRPAMEQVGNLPKFPYGHPRDSRITVWTESGSFTFLPRDLDHGPILAPEYGFFVTKAGAGKTAQSFMAELSSSNVKSIREMTREHSEANWDEAMRELKLPILPAGTTLPAYKQVEDPPMQVEVPEARWQDAWREGVSNLRKGELSYMNLALEAPRPIHAMDAVALHDTAAKWLDGFLQRPGDLADGDFNDGSGSFSMGRLFHGTALIACPGYPSHETYELVHNGGTGRILYDLADHYFFTGDTKWFKANQWRMQAAAEWIIRQRNSYLKDVPNRENLAVAGLHPPQHIADCAWGYSEWKWYTAIDSWYYQGLRRFAEAMREVDPQNAARYLAESERYRHALQKAMDRAITLSPVIRVRNGTYRSYIPPIFYLRGPSIGQVTQIAMTDQDWPLQGLDASGVPAADDIRVDGDLDVSEDVMALNPTHIQGGNRYQLLTEKRKERGLASSEDWFWGGFAPQLGYSSLANVYLRRDEVSSFLRQWVNNYAAFVVPTPEYGLQENVLNQFGPEFVELFQQTDHQRLLSNPGYRNGHALAYFIEEFRNLLVWEDGSTLWLAKATPRAWLEQGKKISVKHAPTYFGTVDYRIISDADHGKITATVEMPARRTPGSLLLRLRHPRALRMKSVTVNGKTWKDFDPGREVISLHDVQGTVTVESNY